MLRQGPIPRFLHGVIEYAAGVLLIASSFLFGFEDGAATARVDHRRACSCSSSRRAPRAPSSLVDSIPIAVHVLLDYALAAVLVASPFLFGFSDESAPTAFFIVLGVAHLLVTIGTRFRAAKE